jgi:hypothetical protein
MTVTISVDWVVMISVTVLLFVVFLPTANCLNPLHEFRNRNSQRVVGLVFVSDTFTTI